MIWYIYALQSLVGEAVLCWEQYWEPMSRMPFSGQPCTLSHWCVYKNFVRKLIIFEFSNFSPTQKWTFLSKSMDFGMNSVSQGAKENVQSVGMQTLFCISKLNAGFPHKFLLYSFLRLTDWKWCQTYQVIRFHHFFDFSLQLFASPMIASGCERIPKIRYDLLHKRCR